MAVRCSHFCRLQTFQGYFTFTYVQDHNPAAIYRTEVKFDKLTDFSR